jgi:hypothetical protein
MGSKARSSIWLSVLLPCKIGEFPKEYKDRLPWMFPHIGGLPHKSLSLLSIWSLFFDLLII